MKSEVISIPDSLQARLDARPEGRALAFYDASRSFAWRDFAATVEDATRAKSAWQDAGLAPGEVAVIVMSDPAETSRVLLGTLLAGGIPLLVASPLIQGSNSSLSEIIGGVVHRTGARVVCYSDRELLESLHPERLRESVAIAADEIPLRPAGHAEFVHRPSESVCAMQLTSGTTGVPRICVWTHQKVQAALEGMANAMDLSTRDIFLNWTPLYHDMGLINNFMLCMVHQIPLVLMSPFDMMRNPALWLQAISDTQATTSWSPNFGFALVAQRCADKQLEGVRLDHVRGLWNAAERIHYQTIVDFNRRFEPYGLRPDAVKTNFGCAENIGGATFSDPHGPFKVEMIDPVTLHERQLAIPAAAGSESMPVVSVGKGHEGIGIHILDEEGNELGEGHVGAVALRTNSRMEGYYGDPDETARAFDGELLKTGDLGYLRDGDLFWTGRTRECIAFRGRKIDPSDFEAPLLKISDLRPGCFVVFGIDDPAAGTEKIVIVAEVKGEMSRTAEDIRQEIHQAVMAHLGLLSVTDIVFVRRGTLTKTSSGKRRHLHFRNLYVQGKLDTYRVGFEA